MPESPSMLPSGLLLAVEAESAAAVPAGFKPLADALVQRHGETVAAILLYGSCLRSGEAGEGIVDLYLIIDDYRRMGVGPVARTLNRLLPPGVHYLETATAQGILRAKVAVISLGDFETGTRSWFHSYLWARFAQGVRILHARDADIRACVNAAVATAVVRFLRETVPAMDVQDADAQTLWAHGLALTYGAEIRPERPGKPSQLARESRGRCEQLTRLALSSLTGTLQAGAGDRFLVGGDRAGALRRWRLRRWQGRLLSLLRLSSAVFTFRNPIDYAAWKVERHTGVRIEVTPELRRHPLLHGWSVLRELLRRGVLR